MEMCIGDRVEGTLFGNGERTGNVDLVTVAMNMFCHGVEPGLDFSRIAKILSLIHICTSPVLIADALINVRITGVRIKGMSIVRLKIIGNPNTAISLILNLSLIHI